MEDLETLRLLSKGYLTQSEIFPDITLLFLNATVVPNITGTTSTLPEEKILEKSFDILFAFDEVSYSISFFRQRFSFNIVILL